MSLANRRSNRGVMEVMWESKPSLSQIAFTLHCQQPSTRSRRAGGDGACSGAWTQIDDWSSLYRQLHLCGLSSWGWQEVVWPCSGGDGVAEWMQAL